MPPHLQGFSHFCKILTLLSPGNSAEHCGRDPGATCYAGLGSLHTGVEASAAQNAPVTTTCLQCGSILPMGARACTFCDSRVESPAQPSGGTSTLSTDASVAWRGEVSER